MKIWHHGQLRTQAEVWANQDPWEIYQDASRRLEADSPAHLRHRWPTLGDANRAMTAAFAGLSPAQKADDLKWIEANLNLVSIS
jgi:hypothetical protein